MSAIIDTLRRVRIGSIYMLTKLRACDPNGIFRDLTVGSLVYATDVIHIWFDPACAGPINYGGISLETKEDDEWGASGGFSIGYRNETVAPDTDTCKRWLGLVITGDEHNARVTAASTPDYHDWRAT